jgi:ribose transport system permease protein
MTQIEDRVVPAAPGLAAAGGLADVTPTPARRGPRWLRRVLHQRELGVIAALVMLCVYGTVGTDGFLTTDNLLNVGQQGSLIGIMAVGMTFVIVTGEIDLSVGSIYVLASTVVGVLLEHGMDWELALVIGMAIGAAAGLVNGLITVTLGLPSFIVTLGTLSVFRGVALLSTNASPINLDSAHHNIDQFSLLGNGTWFGIPMQLLILVVVAGLGAFVLRYTRFGFHVYAVGGSREAARLCGIAADRVRVLAFVIVGALSALAGTIGLAYLLNVQGTTGTGLELLVITAVIIGGAALFGGSGTMLGTVVGVLLIAALQNVLVLANLSSYWQTIVIGVVIIAAVAFDAWVRRRSAYAQ